MNSGIFIFCLALQKIASSDENRVLDAQMQSVKYVRFKNAKWCA